MRILTIVAISVVFGLAIMQYAHGQTESPFANRIMIIDKTLQVLLSMDEDCDEQQFSEAVSYYIANGFPHEGAL